MQLGHHSDSGGQDVGNSPLGPVHLRSTCSYVITRTSTAEVNVEVVFNGQSTLTVISGRKQFVTPCVKGL